MLLFIYLRAFSSSSFFCPPPSSLFIFLSVSHALLFFYGCVCAFSFCLFPIPRIAYFSIANTRRFFFSFWFWVLFGLTLFFFKLFVRLCVCVYMCVIRDSFLSLAFFFFVAFCAQVSSNWRNYPRCKEKQTVFFFPPLAYTHTHTHTYTHTKRKKRKEKKYKVFVRNGGNKKMSLKTYHAVVLFFYSRVFFFFGVTCKVLLVCVSFFVYLFFWCYM